MRATRSCRPRSTPGAQLDIIVNNAGYTVDAPLHKMSDDAFQRMLDIHAVVPFRVISAAAPHLREPAKADRERGEEVSRKIVNVSSISGTMGNAGQANYAAGKAAVVGLTKTLAEEGGQFPSGRVRTDRDPAHRLQGRRQHDGDRRPAGAGRDPGRDAG